MKSRSFAEVLAEWQGGIRPKPGTSTVVEDVPEEKIVEIYGYVPTAVSSDWVTFVFRKSRPGYYNVTVHWGK